MTKRIAFLALLLGGCSTAPLADMLDLIKPGRIRRATVPPYGGVCAPRPVGSPVAGPLPVTVTPPPFVPGPTVGNPPPPAPPPGTPSVSTMPSFAPTSGLGSPRPAPLPVPAADPAPLPAPSFP